MDAAFRAHDAMNTPTMIRELRGDESREAVAQRAGMSQQHLARLEMRPGDPEWRPLTPDTVAALCRAYRVLPFWLLDEDVPEANLDAVLAFLLRRIDRDRKRTAIRLMAVLAYPPNGDRNFDSRASDRE